MNCGVWAAAAVAAARNITIVEIAFLIVGAIYIPMPMVHICVRGPQPLLTRSVLYTAITRARELLIIVGNEETVAAMTRNDRRQRRYSGLKLRLEGKA